MLNVRNSCTILNIMYKWEPDKKEGLKGTLFVFPCDIFKLYERLYYFKPCKLDVEFEGSHAHHLFIQLAVEQQHHKKKKEGRLAG